MIEKVSVLYVVPADVSAKTGGVLQDVNELIPEHSPDSSAQSGGLGAVHVAVNPAAVEETRRGFSSQTYAAELIEFLPVLYVPGAPGAKAAALNAAREQATGDFVVHAEPGVIWDGNKIERQVYRFQNEPTPGASVHRMTSRDRQGKTQSIGLKEIQRYGARIGCFLSSPWGPGAAMLPLEAAKELGAYRSIDEVMWEYAIRLVDRGIFLDLMDEDLAIWDLDVAASLGHAKSRRPLIPTRMCHPFLKSYLERAIPDSLIPDSDLASKPFGQLIQAALFQRNDDLGASHSICQAVDKETGIAGSSYWHGIVHRREPDFNNAKSWFRKVENLSAYPEIFREVGSFLQRVLQIPDYGEAREIALCFLRHLESRGTWDPFFYMDLCEKYLKDEGRPEELKLLEEIQESEFTALFDWTYRKAIGEA